MLRTRALLRSTALAVLFASVLPFAAPDLFVYKSAHAEAQATPAIPDWIKASCCGPSDVHRLRPDQVRQTDDGKYWIVEGYHEPVPAARAEPSHDSDYWIFYRDVPPDAQSGVYCFFIPMNF